MLTCISLYITIFRTLHDILFDEALTLTMLCVWNLACFRNKLLLTYYLVRYETENRNYIYEAEVQ